MSKADKMFEELRYNKKSGYLSVSYNKDFDCRVDTSYILFDLENKTFKVTWDYGYGREIDVSEHKAIHEKLKELGWLDEKLEN